jgi:hypothetical protein
MKNRVKVGIQKHFIIKVTLANKKHGRGGHVLLEQQGCLDVGKDGGAVQKNTKYSKPKILFYGRI